MATKTATTESKARRPIPTYLIVKAVAYGMFAAGLGLSVTHIFDLFRDTLGSTFVTALFVPVFIDGLQLVGRLIRGDSFAKSTQITGRWVQGFGALASLTANLVAGHSVGDKVGGAIFVIGYIVVELIAERIRPAVDDQQAAATAQQTAKAAQRSASAQKAAATRAANKAKAASTAKAAARKARTEQLTKTAAPAMAHDPAYI